MSVLSFLIASIYSLIIVCLEKPVSIVKMVLENVLKSAFCFVPKWISTFFDRQRDRTKLQVDFRTHQQKFVASFAPSVFDMNRFGFVVFRIGHHPAKESNFLEQFFRHTFGLETLNWHFVIRTGFDYIFKNDETQKRQKKTKKKSEREFV